MIAPKDTALAAAVAAMIVCSCSLDRTGVGAVGCDDSSSCSPVDECVDRRCLPRQDASPPRPPVDAATDATRDALVDAPEDAGPPPHCGNGRLDADESDTDCGGSCTHCRSCARCATGVDCATGVCVEGRCQPELSSIVTPAGAVIPAFVRDGAVLLAHYAPGTFHTAYDPRESQRMDTLGGSTPPDGWAPDPCRESGHIDFSSVIPANHAIRLECGDEIDRPATSISSTLFDRFALGDYGTVGATGAPGWATISATMSGLGRTSYGSCGVSASGATGGIAYCDGRATNFSNHLVSYTVFTGGGSPYVGCGGTGCSGPTCPTHVWVWADPR